MAQLTVRGVAEDIVAALKARVAWSGRSAEAEHRRILEEALRPDWSDAFYEAARAARQASAGRGRHDGPVEARSRPRGRLSAEMDAEDAPLVVDASVALKWLVEEAGSEAALALRSRDLAAPVLLWIEVANVLRTLVIRGATDRSRAVALLRLLQSAPLVLVETDDALEARALELAPDLGHPVYDCVYLATAERLGRTLVTADERFLKALRPTPHASRAIALEAVP